MGLGLLLFPGSRRELEKESFGEQPAGLLRARKRLSRPHLFAASLDSACLQPGENLFLS